MNQFRIEIHLKACRHFLVLLLLFCLMHPQSAEARHIVIRDKSLSDSLAKKEAIIILTGFGSIYHSAREQKRRFKNQGFDLFIPDYIKRASLDKSAASIEKFVLKYRLREYKKVHVFSYIIGSWTLNKWIEKSGLQNIGSIVYDRSALQERVPPIVNESNPFMSRVVFGKVIFELANTPYKGIDTLGNVKIGILMECKATRVLWSKKKAYDRMPPPDFSVAATGQKYHDFCYVFASHDDLYTNLKDIAPMVIHFFRNGNFGPQADRTPCSEDPFKPYRKT